MVVGRDLGRLLMSLHILTVKTQVFFFVHQTFRFDLRMRTSNLHPMRYMGFWFSMFGRWCCENCWVKIEAERCWNERMKLSDYDSKTGRVSNPAGYRTFTNLFATESGRSFERMWSSTQYSMSLIRCCFQKNMLYSYFHPLFAGIRCVFRRVYVFQPMGGPSRMRPCESRRIQSSNSARCFLKNDGSLFLQQSWEELRPFITSKNSWTKRLMKIEWFTGGLTTNSLFLSRHKSGKGHIALRSMALPWRSKRFEICLLSDPILFGRCQVRR